MFEGLLLLWQEIYYLACYSIFRTTPEVSSKLYFVELCQVLEKLWLFSHKRADLWLPNFGFKRSFLSLLNPIWTGGGGGIRPQRFFLYNSKTPGDIEKKLSDFNFTPLMDILRILSITIVVRCCHSNLLFPMCHVIFWVEKTKKLELFSR